METIIIKNNLKVKRNLIGVNTYDEENKSRSLKIYPKDYNLEAVDKGQIDDFSNMVDDFSDMVNSFFFGKNSTKMFLIENNSSDTIYISFTCTDEENGEYTLSIYDEDTGNLTKIEPGRKWQFSEYGGLSLSLIKFYKDVAASKRQESWEELLNLDGPVVMDLQNYTNKEAMVILNCKNNPFYFLDILGFKMDIGSYMGIRLHRGNHPVSLESPSSLTESCGIAYGYALWKLLFTDEEVLVPIEDHQAIEDIYDALPEFLKIKSLEVLADNLLTFDDVEELDAAAMNDINIIYVDKKYNEEMKFNSKTLIAANFTDAKTYYQPIIDKLGVASNPFKQVKFNMFDLGYDMDKAEELLAYEDDSLANFLEKYVL